MCYPHVEMSCTTAVRYAGMLCTLKGDGESALTSMSHVPASSPANFRKVSYDAIRSFHTVPCLKSVTCASLHDACICLLLFHIGGLCL